jgi:hypothetical protein
VELPLPHLRFGDDVLIFAADDEWDAVSERARGRGLALDERTGAEATGSLYLVTQVGDLFQRLHPDVPVLYSKGRYLVVGLDDEAAEQLQTSASRDFVVRPVQEREVVFDVYAPDPEHVDRSPWVADLVALVSHDRVVATLERLASFPTRHSTSRHFTEAATWAEAQLQASGFVTRREQITLGARTCLNVVAEKPGHGPGARELVIVTAHLDSINANGGATARAPGADDNASGSTGVLEIGAALKDHQAVHDLRLILFGFEEQGLHGSRQHVARLSGEERTRIRAVVNMDMIATLNTPTPAVLLEGAPVSQAVIDGLAAAAAAHTTLTVQTSINAADSDHVPFIEAGLPAVLTIEGADRTNANVHSERDTLAQIDYGLMLEILRMNVAYVATTLGKA